MENTQYYIESYLQCALINANVRKSWLVEKHNLSFLRQMLKTFPKLKKSFTNFGIIISHNKYNKIKNETELGNILGYPCFEDFQHIINSDCDAFLISLKYETSNNEICEIFVNRSLNLNKLDEFTIIAENAQKIVQNDNFLLKNIKKIYIETSCTFGIETIKKSIIENNMNKEIMAGFINCLWNDEYSDKILNFKYDFNNNTHKIVALMMLTDYKNSLLKFTEITENEYKKIMDQKSSDILKILSL